MDKPLLTYGSLPDAETTVRILVRHLPTFLSEKALTEFFLHYGADSFQYFNSGKMAGAAILSFSNAEKGGAAFNQLTTLELFGKKLRVEYVRRPKRKEFKKREPFPSIAPDLGVDYPSDPTLEYTYPDATPTIVANISQALLRVPRFYTQVLHLMNKMNLPPPFGSPASYNPALIKTKRKKQSSAPPPAAAEAAAKPQREEKDDLSSSESELESDTETQPKRPRPALSSAEFERQMRAAKAEVVSAPPPSQPAQRTAHPTPPQYATAPTPVMPMAQLNPQLVPQAYAMYNPFAPYAPLAPPLNPALVASKPPAAAAAVPAVPTAAPRPTPASTARSFLTTEELAQRMPLDELRAKYKWSETPPFSKLYVKNLPTDATLRDLEYIFGRYFASDSETKSGLDIKIMEGKMKGSAFVGFPTVELAQQAQADINGVLYRGQPLVVLFGKK